MLTIFSVPSLTDQGLVMWGEATHWSQCGPLNSEDDGLSIDPSVVTSETHIKVVEINCIQYSYSAEIWKHFKKWLK